MIFQHLAPKCPIDTIYLTFCDGFFKCVEFYEQYI